MSIMNSRWLVNKTNKLHSTVGAFIFALYFSSWFGLAAAVFIHSADLYGYVVGTVSGVVCLILALLIIGKTLLHMKKTNARVFTIFTSMTGQLWYHTTSEQRVFDSYGATVGARITGLLTTFLFLFASLFWMGFWAMVLASIRFWIL